MGERLKQTVANPALDWGVCHMDLTLDNVFRDGDIITVFDFDSSAECWRALEPYKVLRMSEGYFKEWLEGYRLVRPFQRIDEEAVGAFSIIGDLRVVAWDLGVATSSRGTPKLGIPELKKLQTDGLIGRVRTSNSGRNSVTDNFLQTMRRARDSNSRRL